MRLAEICNGDLVRGFRSSPVAGLAAAALSFLGAAVPSTQPSLGTLIGIGNDFLFSGECWITILPGAAVVVTVLAINLLGDGLRDALDPQLR